jgi:hypothetical protein
MSDKKISQLPASTTPLGGTEELAVVQSGDTKKVSVENVLTSTQPSGIVNAIAYLNATKNLAYSANFTYDGVKLLVGTNSSFSDAIADFYQTTNAARYVLARNPNTGTSAAVFFNASAGSGGDLRLGAYGTNHSTLANQATIYNHKINGSLFLGTGGATKLGISYGGDVTVNTGNLVIGTAGKGIDFSADGQAAGMTSELLDDYEEGTWTPVLVTANNSSYPSDVANGSYTKIGRMVRCTAVYQRTSDVPSVGSLMLIRNSSLPFVMPTSSALNGQIIGHFGVGNAGDVLLRDGPAGYIVKQDGVENVLYFLSITGSGEPALYNPAADTDADHIAFELTYFVE